MENELDFLNSIDSALQEVNFDNITSESSGFDELPAGYYLVELVRAEIKLSKSTGEPMVAFAFKGIDNGYILDDTTYDWSDVGVGKGRYLNVYDAKINSTNGIKRLISDLMKFVDAVGEPIVHKEDVSNSQLLQATLEALVEESCRMWLQRQEGKDKEGKPTFYTNMISWQKAEDLKLPK